MKGSLPPDRSETLRPLGFCMAAVPCCSRLCDKGQHGEFLPPCRSLTVIDHVLFHHLEMLSKKRGIIFSLETGAVWVKDLRRVMLAQKERLLGKHDEVCNF